MRYEDMTPAWQKTKGAILALLIVVAAWGAYRGYWAYQWAKAGLFKAHDAHGFLVGPVALPGGQQYLTVTDENGVVRVVPMSQILAALASARAQSIVDEARQAAPPKAKP